MDQLCLIFLSQWVRVESKILLETWWLCWSKTLWAVYIRIKIKRVISCTWVWRQKSYIGLRELGSIFIFFVVSAVLIYAGMMLSFFTGHTPFYPLSAWGLRITNSLHNLTTLYYKKFTCYLSWEQAWVQDPLVYVCVHISMLIVFVNV